MNHWAYLLLLLACLVGTAPLELLLHTQVYARWRRWGLALLPAVLVFGAWDVGAVAQGDWWFNPRYVLPFRLLGLPLEEWLFFLVIPTCAILTLEAVRATRPQWHIGDEPHDADGRS